jgi:hypothetical protein
MLMMFTDLLGWLLEHTIILHMGEVGGGGEGGAGGWL